MIPLALCFVALVAGFIINGWGGGLLIAALILLVFLVDLCVSLSRKNEAQRATVRAKGSRTDTDDGAVSFPVVLTAAVADVADDGKDSSGGFWSSVGDFFSSDSSSGGGGYSGGDSGGGDGGGGGGGD